MEHDSAGNLSTLDPTVLADDCLPPTSDLAWLDDVFKPGAGDSGALFPPPAAHPELPLGKLLAISKTASGLSRRLDAVLSIRQEVLIQRDQVMYEWDSARYKQAFVSESKEDFSKHLSAIEQQLPHHPSTVQLRQLHDQLFSDYGAFLHQAEKLHLLQQQLRADEMKMQTQEKFLGKRARELEHQLHDLGLPETDTAAASTCTSIHSQSQHTEPQPLHPVLEEYYDKLSDMHIMRERLDDLLSELDEARTRRGLREDQSLLEEDQPMPHVSSIGVPDDLEATLEKDILQAERAFQDAVHSVSTATQACKDQGLVIPVETAPGPTDNEVATTPKPSKDLEVLGPPSPLLRLASPLAPSSRKISSVAFTALTGRLDGASTPEIARSRRDVELSKEKVETWMNHTEPDGIDPYMETAFERQDTTRPRSAASEQINHPPQGYSLPNFAAIKHPNHIFEARLSALPVDTSSIPRSLLSGPRARSLSTSDLQNTTLKASSTRGSRDPVKAAVASGSSSQR